MPAVTSAAGLLTLLDDDNDELKKYALTNLDKVVDQFWYQISGSIAAVEALYEDEDFKDRELAALIASKVRWWAVGAGVPIRGCVLSGRNLSVMGDGGLSASKLQLPLSCPPQTSPHHRAISIQQGLLLPRRARLGAHVRARRRQPL
jgi:hypothetical protein